jgi:hypothetical protein
MSKEYTHLFHFKKERNPKWGEDILAEVGNWDQHLIICQVQLISWDFLYPTEYNKCNTMYKHIILLTLKFKFLLYLYAADKLHFKSKFWKGRNT